MRSENLREKVYIVDDDPSVLRAVGRLVRSAGWDAVSFESPRAFLEEVAADAAGCLVLDITMPGLDGFGLQEALARSGTPLPIVFLTGTGDIPMSVRAMKLGAVNFLCKPCHDNDLIEAINEAVTKDRERRATESQLRIWRDRLALLTSREHEVMLGVAAGLLNKQIADNLGVVEQTVKVHRSRVMAKLQVTSVADLVRLIERTGLSE